MGLFLFVICVMLQWQMLTVIRSGSGSVCFVYEGQPIRGKPTHFLFIYFFVKKHYFQLQICKGTLVESVNKNMELEMRTGPL